MHVSAPASSANLGPGFDCLGLALRLPFELLDGDELDADGAPPEGFLVAEPTHPAAAAFVVAGGAVDTELWWRSPIPPGRGLGFSGAARVAGAYLAHVRSRPDPDQDAWARAGALRVAAMLEGHPDNAAASTYGGLTVAVGERCVAVPAPEGLFDGLRLLVWSPTRSTSTDASRRVLPETVPLGDAVRSIGNAALWVAAVASGELSLLRTATEDQLHQAPRLAARPDSSAALAAFLARPEVLGAWLSGSGPSVAALVVADPTADAGDATDPAVVVAVEAELAAQLSDAGRLRSLAVDRAGVCRAGVERVC